MYLSRDLHTIQNQHTLTNSTYFTCPTIRQQWPRSKITILKLFWSLPKELVRMSRNNTKFGKNILYFMSRYHIHISSNTIFATFIPVPNPKTINPSWRRLVSRNQTRVEGYPIHTTTESTVTTSHCAFLFIHPNSSFQHRHCHIFASTFHTFTPSNVLFHPFMLNPLFAYPIYLINTNVGASTNTYYTKPCLSEWLSYLLITL